VIHPDHGAASHARAGRTDVRTSARLSVRLLLAAAIVCVVGCAVLLAAGTRADHRAIDALNNSHRYTVMAYSSVTEHVHLEAGTTYIITGSALFYEGRVHLDVVSPSGSLIATRQESGKIRGGWVMASLTPPTSGEYTFEISGNGFTSGYIADDSLRHYSAMASALLPGGLALGGLALVLFLMWAVKRYSRTPVPDLSPGRGLDDWHLPPPT